MVSSGRTTDPHEDQLVELIAQRVAASLREDLEVIAAQMSSRSPQPELLTVGQVAERLGVARSTVYAHWREWGGYKLGSSDKAPIRFDAGALPTGTTPSVRQRNEPMSQPRRAVPRRRRRKNLLRDAPRLSQPLDGIL